MTRSLLWLSLLSVFLHAGCFCQRGVESPFALEKDSFAFSNELRWSYEFSDSGTVTTRKTDPPPEYSLRCFPMVRAAREFFYHAEFRPDLPELPRDDYRKLIKKVVDRNSRCPSPETERVTFPGFENLHTFSEKYGDLLKAECGGSAESFLQRGNWRMVFPVSRAGRQRTVEKFLRALHSGRVPIAHIYQFPNTTLNHAVLIYTAKEGPHSTRFFAYDPNDPSRPAELVYERATKKFIFERNRYFAGGEVRVYEVYRGAFY